MTFSPDDQPASRSKAPALGDQVYLGLKTRILGHEFRMGDPLREDEVATWFSASRLPAREALRRLEQEGLVARVGRRYTVRAYTPDEILVTYRIRAALEHLGAELAVAHLTDAHEAAIAADLAEQRIAAQSRDRGEFSRLDKLFHMSIAAIGSSPALTRELELVMDRVTLIRSHEIAIDSGAMAAYDDHCRIFEAICRRDAAIARSELDYHYATTLLLHHMNPVAQVPPRPDVRRLRQLTDQAR